MTILYAKRRRDILEPFELFVKEYMERAKVNG